MSECSCNCTTTTDCPELAQAGPQGAQGAAGDPAWTTTTAQFTQPAVDATVTVTLGNTSWMAVGEPLFIVGGGTYEITVIPSTTTVTVKNLYSSNTAATTVIASGKKVTPSGFKGTTGSTGAAGTNGTNGTNAHTTCTAQFTQPAASTNASVTVGSTAWMAVSQYIYVENGGYYQVASITSATVVVLTNLGYTSNALAGNIIPVSSKVSPGGIKGEAGAATNGLAAYTTTNANYTQPAVNSNVTISVVSNEWMTVGANIFITGGGTYEIISLTGTTQATIQNLGYDSNSAFATVINSGAKVAPTGERGSEGDPGPLGNSSTTVASNFFQPAINNNVSVTVGTTESMAVGMNLFIATGGYYEVITISSSTVVILKNLGYTGNAGSGSTISAGSKVIAAGVKGASTDYILIREEQTSGTNGGTFTLGAWRTRVLTTEVSDAGGHASLASNQITLALGTYRFRAAAPAESVHLHQVRLANITDSLYYYGMSIKTDNTNNQSGVSEAVGRFTISAPKVFEVQHQCSSTQATTGFGRAVGFGGSEVYTTVEFWRENT